MNSAERPAVAAVLHGRVLSIMMFTFQEGRVTGLDLLVFDGLSGGQ
ncbi:MAG: hypothetical protein WCC45_00680 [Paeniglutamicibacter sp.]